MTAEELALVGSRYFPDDPHLRYWLAVARHRAGRSAEAEAAARDAIERGPELGPPRLLLAGMLLRAGRAREARRALAAPASGPAELRWLAAGVAWRGRLGVASFLGLAFVPLLAWFAPIGAALLLLATLIGLAGWARLGREIDAELESGRSWLHGGSHGAGRSDELGRVLRSLLRRDPGPRVS